MPPMTGRTGPGVLLKHSWQLIEELTRENLEAKTNPGGSSSQTEGSVERSVEGTLAIRSALLAAQFCFFFFPFISLCRRSRCCQFDVCSLGQSKSSFLAALLPTPSVFCVGATDEVTMEEVGQAAQLRAGELIIIVVVLIMWAGNVPSQEFIFFFLKG